MAKTLKRRELVRANLLVDPGNYARCLRAVRVVINLLQIPNGLTVPTLKLNPAWDPLRKDPRFHALMDKYAVTR